VLLGLDVLPWDLLLRDFELVGGGLRCLGYSFCYPEREVDGFSDLETFLLAGYAV
jgi:hypothetical protein